METKLTNKTKLYVLTTISIFSTTVIVIFLLFLKSKIEEEIKYEVSKNETIYVKTIREFNMSFSREIKVEKKYRFIQARVKKRRLRALLLYPKREKILAIAGQTCQS